MIKQSEIVHASLDNIYSEIISLAASVGDCEASIKHTQDLIRREHDNLTEHVDRINRRLDCIERQEMTRESRHNYLFSLFELTPSNFVKWLIGILLLGMLLGSASKINLTEVTSALINLIFGS